MPTTAKLFYSCPETNADLFYFGQFFAPDPFIALEVNRRKIAVLSDLELGRGKKESGFSQILSYSEVKKEASRRFKTPKPGLDLIVRHLLKEYDATRVIIPEDFPASLALQLKAARVQVRVVEGPFIPQREIKNDREALFIREGNAASANGFKVVEDILKKAKITRRGSLNWRGKPLTSERVRIEIEKTLLEQGALSLNTIVAGGEQACDPHERGHGPLRANQLIIVDIFPRIISSGYHGDMTRTYLKGSASEAQKKLVGTVKKAHQVALEKARSGITGASIHRKVVQVMEQAGYQTRKTRDGYEGFFHSTGHGLGLEVHEPPRLGLGSDRLKKNSVVTLEPGLYYPGLGGCRIEDVVRLKPEGSELLSSHPYRWEIR